MLSVPTDTNEKMVLGTSYCQNHENGVTSCFPKKVIQWKNYIFCIQLSNDVNYYLKLKRYNFCNLTIFKLVNEIGDFESL